MLNPFDVIIEKLEGLEGRIQKAYPVQPLPSTEIIDRLELCKRLSITEPTAIRWEKKGVIPSIRIGSSVRYNWPKVIFALENKKAKK